MLPPRPRPRALALDHVGDGADVRRRGAAASAHEIEPAAIGEFFQLRRQRVRRLAEFPFGVRQTRIRIARDAVPRHLVERPYVVGHQVRTGGAVHSHAQQIVTFDGGVECVDGLPAQHGPGAFDGDTPPHRNLPSEIARQSLHRHQSRLEAARVEAGLDQQKVGPAFDQAFGLQVVIGAQRGEGGGAGDVEVFVGGPHGTGDEARLVRRGVLVRDLARQLRGGEVELVFAVFQMVVGEGDSRPTEGICLDDVRAGFQILAMDVLYDVGPRDVEDFRTVLPPQVVGPDGQGCLMDHGAHSPVEHEYTLFQAVDQRRVALQRGGHKGVFLSLTGRSRTGLRRGLTCLSQGALFAPRGGCPLGTGLSPVFPGFWSRRYARPYDTYYSIPLRRGVADALRRSSPFSRPRPSGPPHA